MDFYVENDGTLWVLNQTGIIARYLFNELDSGETQMLPELRLKLSDNTQYLSLDIEVDYKVPKDDTYSLVLSNTNSTNNVEEYLILSGTEHEPILVGYYTLPVTMMYNGEPP